MIDNISPETGAMLVFIEVMIVALVSLFTAIPMLYNVSRWGWRGNFSTIRNAATVMAIGLTIKSTWDAIIWGDRTFNTDPMLSNISARWPIDFLVWLPLAIGAVWYFYNYSSRLRRFTRVEPRDEDSDTSIETRKELNA